MCRGTYLWFANTEFPHLFPYLQSHKVHHLILRSLNVKAMVPKQDIVHFRKFVIPVEKFCFKSVTLTTHIVPETEYVQESDMNMHRKK